MAGHSGTIDGPESEIEYYYGDDDLATPMRSKPKRYKNHILRPTARPYTLEDFNPTVKDPRCMPDWPLANLWPVYVGNFKIHPPQNYVNKTFMRPLRNYFLSKGLPMFKLFPLKGSFHETHQLPKGLHDMLAYFGSKQDADAAIARCHMDTYYSHRLHVYDGRTPERYPINTTYRFNHTEPVDQFETETHIKQYMSRYLPVVKSVRKTDPYGAFVLMHRPLYPKETDAAIAIPRFQMVPISEPAQKQRFVEGDVVQEILLELATNRQFATGKPSEMVVKSFLDGYKPYVPIKGKKNSPGWDSGYSEMIEAQNQALGDIKQATRIKRKGLNKVKLTKRAYREECLDEQIFDASVRPLGFKQSKKGISKKALKKRLQAQQKSN